MGAISIDPNGSGNLTLGSADNTSTSLSGNVINIDAAGALAINSSAGAISIGNDDIDQAINIGTQEKEQFLFQMAHLQAH